MMKIDHVNEEKAICLQDVIYDLPTLLTNSIQPFPETLTIPRAAGAKAVAIEEIGSSGAYCEGVMAIPVKMV